MQRQSASPRLLAIALAFAGLAPVVAQMLPARDGAAFVTLMLTTAALIAALLAEGHRPRIDRLSLAAGAVALAVVASALASRFPSMSLTFGAENGYMAASSLTALLATFLIARRMRLTREATEPWALALAVAATFLGATWALRGMGVDAPPVFGNADFGGAALVALLPPCAAFALAKTRPLAVGWWAVVAVCAIGAALSGSDTVRAVLAAEVVAIALIAPRMLRAPFAATRRYASLSRAGLTAALLAIVFAVTMVAVPGARPAPVDELLSQPSALIRVDMWRAAMDVIAERPVLGSGPDAFALESQRGISARMLRLEGNRASGATLLMRDPHALPLLVLANLGVVGSLALLALLGVWVAELVSLVRAKPKLAPLRLAHAGGFVGFLACMLLIPWSVRFAALPALLAGLAVADPETPARESNSRIPAVALGLAAAVLVGLGASAALGEYYWARAQKAVSGPEIERLLDRAAAAQPNRPRLRYEAAAMRGQALVQGATDLATYRTFAEGAGEQVGAHAPYVAGLVQPSLDQALLTGRRDLTWERDRLDRAERIAADFPDVVLERAHFALAEGDLPAARTQLDRAADLGITVPRRFVYENLYWSAKGDTARAAEAAKLVRANAPWLSGLLR